MVFYTTLHKLHTNITKQRHQQQQHASDRANRTLHFQEVKNQDGDSDDTWLSNL